MDSDLRWPGSIASRERKRTGSGTNQVLNLIRHNRVFHRRRGRSIGCRCRYHNRFRARDPANGIGALRSDLYARDAAPFPVDAPRTQLVGSPPLYLQGGIRRWSLVDVSGEWMQGPFNIVQRRNSRRLFDLNLSVRVERIARRLSGPSFDRSWVNLGDSRRAG